MLKAKEDLFVIAAQKGNEQAFTFLCKYYYSALYRFAYKLCGDSQLAQDALQNAWLKLSKNLRTLEDPRAFKSWIFKAVRWSVYDLLRKSIREEKVFEQDISVDEMASPEAPENIQSDHLKEMIALLPEIDKQAIYLFYLEDMKISEISDVLQIPTGTIKSRLNRARKTLQEQVTSNMEK